MNLVSTDKNALNNIYSNIVESFDGNIGNCVLLLGPELAINNKGVRHKDYFRKLSKKHPDIIEKYFEEENLFSFKEEVSLRPISREIKDFYKNVGDTILLEKIARIKFPLIINFSPDAALTKVFEQNDIDYIEDHFSRSTVPNNNLEKPTKQKPVVYNIFGSIEADGSLILDHGHMHKALEKLLAERSLPDNLEAYLQNANTYIFLGFNYESWYYQLLCHRLNVKTPERYSILSTPDCRHNDYTNRIMGKHFRMDFTGESPEVTIDRIISTCEESDLNNTSVLREIKIGGKYSLVFSYAWRKKGADSKFHIENIVDWLESEIDTNKACSFNVFRDKKDLSFGDNLKEFMNALSQCKTIVQVVSDEYLKSRNCMYEAVQIHKNKGDNKIYRMLLKEDEKDQFNEARIIEYKNYWKKLYEEGIGQIEQSTSDPIEKGKAIAKWTPVLEIHEFLPTFFEDLLDNMHLVILKGDFKIERNDAVVLKRAKSEIILEKICGEGTTQ